MKTKKLSFLVELEFSDNITNQEQVRIVGDRIADALEDKVNRSESGLAPETKNGCITESIVIKNATTNVPFVDNRMCFTRKFI